MGRLFVLQFIVPRTLPLASIIIENKANIWHRRFWPSKKSDFVSFDESWFPWQQQSMFY